MKQPAICGMIAALALDGAAVLMTGCQAPAPEVDRAWVVTALPADEETLHGKSAGFDLHLDYRAAVSCGAISAHMAPMTETTTKFLTLGEITDALAALPPTMRVFVMMGGDLFSPDGVDSYRGNYFDLAIEPINTSHERTVGDLLSCLIAADGQTYDGYKGGEYQMHIDTSVVVSQHSRCSQDYVTGVEVRDGAAVVVTEKITY